MSKDFNDYELRDEYDLFPNPLRESTNPPPLGGEACEPQYWHVTAKAKWSI